MATKARYTVDQVAQALENAAGIHTHAAAQLGCAPNTIKNYVQKHKRLQELEERVRNEIVDLAETQLLKMIRDDTHKSHATAVIFFLKCKGKERGYTERSE